MRRARGPRLAPAMFLAPFGIMFAAFFLLPIGYAAVQSLYATHRSGLGFGGGTTSFAWFQNYADVLRDPLYRGALERITVLGLVQVPVMLGLATLLALLLDSGLARLQRFFRLAYFMPYGVPGVVAVLLWANLYVPQLSPINDLLRHVGINNVDLLSPGAIMASIGNITTWSYVGYNMLILLTSLQAVPQSLSESAAMDGAGPWRTAWHVKLPLLRPALVMTVMFSIIGQLQLFSEPSVLRAITPSVTSDFSPNLYIFTTVFDGNHLNLGAAQAVTLALITFVLSVGFLRWSRRWSEL